MPSSTFSSASNFHPLFQKPTLQLISNAPSQVKPPLFGSAIGIHADKLIIHAPKEGLVKKNSFLHPKLNLKNKWGNQKAVIATDLIKQGEIICIFVGDIITQKELHNLQPDLQDKTLQLAPHIYQLASKNPENKAAFDEAEYFNHSCSPNSFISGNNVLVAARDIKKGENVCFDYGTSDTAGNPDTNAWNCACGSDNCRGTNDPMAYQQIIKSLQQKHGLEGALNRVAQYVAEFWKRDQIKN